MLGENAILSVNQNAPLGWLRSHLYPIAFTAIVLSCSFLGLAGASSGRFLSPNVAVLANVLGFCGALLVPVVASLWCGVVFQNSFRFIALLLVLSLAGACLSWISSFPRRFNWEFFVFPFAISLPIVLTTELVKLAGKFERISEASRTDVSPEALQFGIRQLIFAVAVASVLLGAREYFFQTAKGLADGRLPVLLFATAMVSMTLLTVWALMGTAVSIRLGISFVLSCAMTFVVVQAMPDHTGDGSNQIACGIIFLGNWIAMTTLMLLLRKAGYRFISSCPRYETDLGQIA